MATQAKTFSYAVSLDRDGAATSDEGGSALPNEEAWSPEHLLLAGLARCTLTSLDYHARRIGVASGGSASCERRGDAADDRRPLRIRADQGRPRRDDRAGAAERSRAALEGERDCFVGASLTARPRYRWTVNGEDIA